MARRTQKKLRRRRQKAGAWYNPATWFSSGPSVGQQVTDAAKSAAESVQGAVQSATAAVTPAGQPNVATTPGAVAAAGTPPEAPRTNLVGARRRRTVKRRS
jgi:hypothetical protein